MAQLLEQTRLNLNELLLLANELTNLVLLGYGWRQETKSIHDLCVSNIAAA